MVPWEAGENGKYSTKRLPFIVGFPVICLMMSIIIATGAYVTGSGKKRE